MFHFNFDAKSLGMTHENRMVFITLEEFRSILRKEYMELNSKITTQEQEPSKEIYTLAEAGKYLRLSPSTIRKLVRRGKLKKLNIPVKGMRFSHNELTKFSNNYR